MASHILNGDMICELAQNEMKAPKTISSACAACQALCASGFDLSLPPHPSLAMEWRKEPVTFYYCKACGASLVRNPDASDSLWTFGAI